MLTLLPGEAAVQEGEGCGEGGVGGGGEGEGRVLHTVWCLQRKVHTQ